MQIKLPNLSKTKVMKFHWSASRIKMLFTSCRSLCLLGRPAGCKWHIKAPEKWSSHRSEDQQSRKTLTGSALKAQAQKSKTQKLWKLTQTYKLITSTKLDKNFTIYRHVLNLKRNNLSCQDTWQGSPSTLRRTSSWVLSPFTLLQIWLKLPNLFPPIEFEEHGLCTKGSARINIIL